MQTKHMEKAIPDIDESQHTLHTTHVIVSEGIKKTMKNENASLT